MVQSRRWTETPPPLVTKPEDLVRWHGGAALGELDPQVVDAADDDARVGRALLGGAAATGDRDTLGEVFRRAFVATVQVDDTTYDRLGAEVALPYRGIERRDVGVVEVLGHQRQHVVGHQPVEGQALLAHELGDLVLAPLDGLLAALLGEPLADLGARPR